MYTQAYRQAAGFLALFKLALGSGDVSLLLLLAGIFGGCCEVAVAAPPSRPDDERCGESEARYGREGIVFVEMPFNYGYGDATGIDKEACLSVARSVVPSLFLSGNRKRVLFV